MKKSNVAILVLVVLLFIMTIGFVNIKLENKRIQKSIDETFTDSYRNLTLNILNSTIEGIGEDAIHMYNVKNTNLSSIIMHYYPLSSFGKYRNADLNYIIGVLSQSSGYNAITKIDMNLDLYHKIKELPTDGFNNEEILKEAKTAIENALIKD